ncbi:MAG: rod shape-determining protein MreD [Boseongicola sp.]|nr:rod shape-determining protein MreD [Boseongicola sp.]
MADTSHAGRWTYRGVFLALAALVVFAKLLPLHPGPGRFPGPDILILMACAWVVRRPDYLPVSMVAAVFLIADLLFMRPPGLWSALAVVGLEALRRRSINLRDSGFLTEWLTIAVIITGMFLANALALAVFVVDQPGLGLTLIRLITTILVYPIVVVLAARAVGLRKIAPGEVDRLGHRQ